MVDNLNFENIKLIAIDMDGTALNSKHSLSPRIISAIKNLKASKRNIKIIFATGRMLEAVRRFLQKAKMDDFVVAHNGALLIDLKNDYVYKDARIDKKDAQAVCAYAINHNIITHYNLTEQVLVEKKEPLSLKYADELGINMQICSDLTTIKNLPTSILMLGEEQKLKISLNHFDNLNIGKIFIPWFDKYWMLQFLPFGLSKGAAVMELANKLGLKSSEVLSFGDSYNDIEMISQSGIGIAMGNACESLKKVANYTTLSNDEDGVAVVLEKML